MQMRKKSLSGIDVMSKVLVTGANGFVGRHLCQLLRSSYEVRAALRSQKLSNKLSDHEYVAIGEINTNTNWEAALRNVDCVIHLAARVHVMRETAVDPLTEFREVNLHGTMNLAKQAVAAGVKRFIFVSSIKVNGEATTGRAFSEDDEPMPVDPYAISKAEAEEQLLALGLETGLEVVIVRPPLVYGREVGGNFLRLLKLVNRGVPLPLASIKNVRSMVSVSNLCDLLMQCVEHPQAVGQIFLVSDGMDWSTPELIRRIACHMEKPPHLFFFPLPLLKMAGWLLRQSNAIDRLCDSLVIDISKTRERLDWLPPQSADEGVHQVVEWYMENKHA